MTFLKTHKTAVAVVAVFALVGGAAHFSGMTCSSGPCAITSMFSATTAYAGPGCASSKASAGGSCDASSKASKVTAASATSVDGKTCTKEECVKAIMAEKKVGREEAETMYAKMVTDGSCHSAKGASAMTASASGCSGEAKTAASFAGATEGKTCGDKEACIAKCMAEKGMTRAEAEEYYAKYEAAKATQANTGASFTRDSWIDAKVASGLTRTEAEVAAAKAEASGDVKFVSATDAATGGSCCASKASANSAKVEETTPATTATVSTGGTK